MKLRTKSSTDTKKGSVWQKSHGFENSRMTIFVTRTWKIILLFIAETCEAYFLYPVIMAKFCLMAMAIWKS